jgi:site-specific DNA-methyltransferase (adenine-specific)
MTHNIITADVLDWAADYDGEPFHALLTDCPYEMREVDVTKMDEQSKGFMGKEWDGSGVSFNPDTWRALAQHLYPGAFLFVFAGTINDDLISVAMRKAGLRKAVDKAAGAEREILEPRIRLGDKKPYGGDDFGKHGIYGRGNGSGMIDKPSTPLAQQWAGHRYGLQSLKPAVETVLVFQKPYEGKPVDIEY